MRLLRSKPTAITRAEADDDLRNLTDEELQRRLRRFETEYVAGVNRIRVQTGRMERIEAEEKRRKEAEQALRARDSLSEFLKAAWHVVEPSTATRLGLAPRRDLRAPRGRHTRQIRTS